MSPINNSVLGPFGTGKPVLIKSPSVMVKAPSMARLPGSLMPGLGKRGSQILLPSMNKSSKMIAGVVNIINRDECSILISHDSIKHIDPFKFLKLKKDSTLQHIRSLRNDLENNDESRGLNLHSLNQIGEDTALELADNVNPNAVRLNYNLAAGRRATMTKDSIQRQSTKKLNESDSRDSRRSRIMPTLARGGNPAKDLSRVISIAPNFLFQIPQFLDGHDSACISALYPTNQKVSKPVFLDHYLKDISYPTDFLAHEPVAIVIAEMILELAMQIKLLDDYPKWTVLEPTERPEITQLLMTIFEVGDFTFFRNLFYNYMSKLPLVNFNTYNSGVISGKAVNMFLEFSLDKNSPFKTYNKKFNSI